MVGIDVYNARARLNPAFEREIVRLRGGGGLGYR